MLIWVLIIFAVIIFGQCILVGRLLGDVGNLNFKIFEIAGNIKIIIIALKKNHIIDDKETDNWNKNFDLELNQKRRKTDKKGGDDGTNFN